MHLRKCVLLFLLFCCFFGTVAAEICENGVCFDEVWTWTENKTGVTLTDYRGAETFLTIPQEIGGKPVTQLGNNLFAGQMGLLHVTIPGTVTSLGSNVFSNCTGLEGVELSFVLTTIPAGTFRNCLKLESILIPATVKSIGNFAFQNCQSLREIYLPNVSSIGEAAFENCTSLTRVNYSQKLSSVAGFAFRNTPWLDNQTDEFVFIGKMILLKWNGNGTDVTLPWGTVAISDAFAGNTEIENVILPDTIRNVGQYAFQGAVNLRSINLPEYMTTVGANAFDGCRSLVMESLPGKLNSIGANAFRGCEKIRTVVIPEKVKTIPALAFADCPKLTSVTLPDELTKLDKTAFQGSDNVKLNLNWGTSAQAAADAAGFMYLASLQKYDSFITSRTAAGIHIVRYTGDDVNVEVPERIGGILVTEIGTAAFQNNQSVRTVSLPASVKSVGDWAFSYMESLKQIEFPAALRSIGANTFTGCTSLSEIRLPRRLVEIGTDPFDCDPQPVIKLRADSYALAILEEMGYECSVQQ